MNTRLSALSLKKATSSTSKRLSLLRGIVIVLDAILSILLALLVAIFFMWLNGRQHEFDQRQDKSE